ncbi:hypothetical protein J3A83DRAFT_1057575 [Scleroderma citrinum]
MEAQTSKILERVRAIPGNESCTFEKITCWFQRHRNPAHTIRVPGRECSIGTQSPVEATPALRFVDDDSILFPKLTPTQLHQLQVLYKSRPDPAAGVITFWATRLNADREEVAAWILYQREKAKGPPAPPVVEVTDHMSSLSPTDASFVRTHLPTPAKSPSPTRSPNLRFPSLPPIAVKMEESGQEHPRSPVAAHKLSSAIISPADCLTNVAPMIRRPEEPAVS